MKPTSNTFRPPLAMGVGITDMIPNREGVSNLFMIFAPFFGFRHVEVTQRVLISHISAETSWIPFSRRSIISIYIRPSLCIKRLRHKTVAEKIEFHYTPKHGSWLNIAEIEFSVLRRHCLGVLPTKRRFQAWQDRRNQQQCQLATTKDARITQKTISF